MNKNEKWMTLLPDEVRNLPIINLAIPGSHNSMSYGIKRGSKPAPDAEPSMRRLNVCFPWFVRRWARTQSATITEQLNLGVRYFDLRVCQKNDKFFYTHGLYAMELLEPLEEIINFLLANPGEFCILDFQHFYAFQVSHHKQLHNLLLKIFNQRLYSNVDGPLIKCTLNGCEEIGRQLLLIYRRCPLQLPKEFWPSYVWPTPWPNVASMKKLQEFLQNSLISRKSSQGYVSQCILTPTGRYIALRFFSSLRKTAKKVDKKLHSWIENQTPGPIEINSSSKVNVFIADYVNLKDGQFCEMVILLNAKLSNSQTITVEGETQELRQYSS